ncbi:transcription factor ILR3-like [Fagus crenata]
MGSQGNENPSWGVFDDYSLIEDIPVTSLLDPAAFASTTWPPPSHLSFPAPTSHSLEIDDSFANSDGPMEIGSRKRVRSGSCTTSGTKACREKKRRDRLNDRFMELGSILDPGKTPKMDKAVILGDAVRMLTQLRDEAQKLKESKKIMQEKINELKAEKNELRDEKQRLKEEKENLEQHVKALNTQPGFLPHPPTIPATFSASGQVLGSKLVPFMAYPGVSMWQFMPPASVDTSHDHVLRPPVA